MMGLPRSRMLGSPVHASSQQDPSDFMLHGREGCEHAPPTVRPSMSPAGRQCRRAAREGGAAHWTVDELDTLQSHTRCCEQPLRAALLPAIAADQRETITNTCGCFGAPQEEHRRIHRPGDVEDVLARRPAGQQRAAQLKAQSPA